jgi:hypothetical protein
VLLKKALVPLFGLVVLVIEELAASVPLFLPDREKLLFFGLLDDFGLGETAHIDVEFVNLDHVSSCNLGSDLLGNELSALNYAFHGQGLLNSIQTLFFSYICLDVLFEALNLCLFSPVCHHTAVQNTVLDHGNQGKNQVHRQEINQPCRIRYIWNVTLSRCKK